MSERGVGGARGQRHDKARGRWSVPEYQECVDLDTLLEAPSPPAGRRRRKSSRSKSKNEKSRSNSNSNRSGSFGTPQPSRDENGSVVDRKKVGKPSRKQYGRPMSTTHEEEETQDYHSYEDPGYINQDTMDLMHVDSDCILQSPFDSPSSPTVIHARWGEPADDPEEKEVCTEYRPNPFKLGFCVNCQKQHDVNENGDVAKSKEYKKIARPTVSKSAANALDNPAAVENLTPRSRESDVDLAALLQQRRDILLKLTKMEQEKSKKKKEAMMDIKLSTHDSSARHTMFVAESSVSTLANLRRMGSNGRTTPSAPQSLRVSRATSTVVVSPRNVSSWRGMSKSVSLGGNLDDDDEPARNDWL